MQVKNLDAAKQLVNEYRSITLEQIEKVADNIDSDDGFGLSVLRNITGFGSINTCILCSAMGHPLPERCEGCIHSFFENGYENCDGYMCVIDKTYDDIESSKSACELLNAVRKRADYLDSLIKTCENDN